MQNNQQVVIMGGSSGIGLATAQDIVKEMADDAIRRLQECVQLLPKDNAS